MPSWKIHSKWGTKLLGFSEREIDYLIDSTHVGNHAAGCWDEKVLERQLSYVEQKYGQKGQSYYILHCILDRAEQRLLSILSEEAIKHCNDRITDEVIREIERKLRDELLQFPKSYVFLVYF